MTLPHRPQRRRRPIEFDEVVRPELRRGTGEVLEKTVYRLPGFSDSNAS